MLNIDYYKKKYPILTTFVMIAIAILGYETFFAGTIVSAGSITMTLEEEFDAKPNTAALAQMAAKGDVSGITGGGGLSPGAQMQAQAAIGGCWGP
jgi:hypothetical protein